MIAGVFELPAGCSRSSTSFTSNYAISIALIAVVVMVIITPLTLKSTKGMLEMQRLAPESASGCSSLPQRPAPSSTKR